MNHLKLQAVSSASGTIGMKPPINSQGSSNRRMPSRSVYMNKPPTQFGENQDQQHPISIKSPGLALKQSKSTFNVDEILPVMSNYESMPQFNKETRMKRPVFDLFKEGFDKNKKNLGLGGDS